MDSRGEGAGTLDEHITTCLDVQAWFDRKWEAVLAHHSQIAEDSWLRVLDDDVRRQGFGQEAFILAFARVDAPAGAGDLFAGLR